MCIYELSALVVFQKVEISHFYYTRTWTTVGPFESYIRGQGAKCQTAYTIDKVITTMVIRPLDDPTRRAQSVIADLRPLCLGVRGG